MSESVCAHRASKRGWGGRGCSGCAKEPSFSVDGEFLSCFILFSAFQVLKKRVNSVSIIIIRNRSFYIYVRFFIFIQPSCKKNLVYACTSNPMSDIRSFLKPGAKYLCFQHFLITFLHCV